MKDSNFLKKSMVLIVAVILVITGVSGCRSSEKKSDKKYSLNVVTSTTSALDNPLVQLAEAKGYFDTYDLTIKKTPLELNGIFESLSFGKVDTTYGQLIPPLSYGAQGSDVKIFAGTLSGGMAVITTAEKAEELKDLKNWRGKNIGVIQLSTSEMVTKYVLKNEYGYKKGSEINYSLIEDYPSIVLAVAKGNVDIGFISSQYLDSALEQGLVYLFPLTNIMEDYVCCRQSAYTPSFDGNEDAFAAYLKGQIRAYNDYAKDEDGSVKTLVTASGESEDYVRKYVYDTESSANRKYNPDPNYDGTLAVYETLLEWDYVESGVDLPEFFDINVYAKALKEIIEEYPDEEFYRSMWDYFLSHNKEYPNFEKTFDGYLN